MPVIESERNEHQWRRVKYSYMDCRRYANLRNITVLGPKKIWNTKLISIACLWVKNKHTNLLNNFIDHVYYKFWKRELDLETSVGLDIGEPDKMDTSGTVGERTVPEVCKLSCLWELEAPIEVGFTCFSLTGTWVTLASRKFDCPICFTSNDLLSTSVHARVKISGTNINREIRDDIMTVFTKLYTLSRIVKNTEYKHYGLINFHI